MLKFFTYYAFNYAADNGFKTDYVIYSTVVSIAPITNITCIIHCTCMPIGSLLCLLQCFWQDDNAFYKYRANCGRRNDHTY